MTMLAAKFRIVVGAFALLALAVSTHPASAQQPNSVNPQASVVKEQQLLQQLKTIEGRGTIPDTKSYTIEQPAGRDWRHFHEVTLRWIGAIIVLGILAVLILFYLWRGMVRIPGGRSGRTIVRFNAFERFVHWMTATCFIILAISGLNVTFGKPLLLPLMSPEAFTAWSQWAKYAHDYLNFPFTLGVIMIFLIWIAGNIPNHVDVEWFKRGGGIVGHDHPPAYRFNAGQKTIYWIVVLGGTAPRCCWSPPCWATSISVPSAWRARLRPWEPAPSISTGPRSTTVSGSTRKWLAPAPMSRSGSPR
jgi:formate dehydrogenase subunit gamma